MKIYVADVKKSHEKNPNCPMRLAVNQNGQIYCVDCGMVLLSTRIDVVDIIDGTVYKKILEKVDDNCSSN